MYRIAAAFLAVALLATPAAAGKYNKKVSVGDKAPAWTGLEGTDGKKHALSDVKEKVVVVVCTCNHCPVAVAYEDRIIDLAKKYQDQDVAIVAFNVNTSDADALPAMKTRAQKKGFNFTYVYDPSQELGKKYGATRTPEFFVLDEKRNIVYMGAMDDNMSKDKVTKDYLSAAVDAALKGETPEVTETRAVGCNVQYNR